MFYICGNYFFFYISVASTCLHILQLAIFYIHERFVITFMEVFKFVGEFGFTFIEFIQFAWVLTLMGVFTFVVSTYHLYVWVT